MDGDDVSPEEEEDFFDAGDKASVSVPPSRIEKANKRRDFIKKLTLSQCFVENVPDGANTAGALVSIAGIPLSKLLLSELKLFCASKRYQDIDKRKNRRWPNSLLHA